LHHKQKNVLRLLCNTVVTFKHVWEGIHQPLTAKIREIQLELKRTESITEYLATASTATLITRESSIKVCKI